MDVVDTMGAAAGYVLVVGLAVGFMHGWYWSKLVRPRLRNERRFDQFGRRWRTS